MTSEMIKIADERMEKLGYCRSSSLYDDITGCYIISYYKEDVCIFQLFDETCMLFELSVKIQEFKLSLLREYVAIIKNAILVEKLKKEFHEDKQDPK